MIELFNTDCIPLMEQFKEEGKWFDAVITDPPYFVVPKGKKTDRFTWDNFSSMEDFIQFTTNWYRLAYSLLKQDSFMFIFWSQKHLKMAFDIFDVSRMVLWNYENLVLGGGGDFAYDYEPVFIVKKGAPKLPPGKHSCVMKFTKPQSNFKTDKLLHPTQKPLALLQHLVVLSGAKDILDPFMGSGTTGVAAKELGRNFVGCEKDERYFKISQERILHTQATNPS